MGCKAFHFLDGWYKANHLNMQTIINNLQSIKYLDKLTDTDTWPPLEGRSRGGLQRITGKGTEEGE